MQIDNVAVGSACIFTFSMGTVTPAATAAALSAVQNFDAPAGTPDLQLTDIVVLNNETAAGNSVVMKPVGRVIDANTIGITYTNPTAGSLTHAAGVVRATVIRPV